MSLQSEKIIMPAEWEYHNATWLAWPNDKDFFGDRILNVEKTYIEIIKALYKDEIIKLVVLNQKEEERIGGVLLGSDIDLSRVIFYQTDYTDVWMRDYGPTFVKNGKELSFIKWQYKGYNKKFPELFKDNEVFLNLKDKLGLEMHEVEYELEGGAIHVNGSGTLLTTRECLLENRGFKNEEEASALFQNTLGVKNVIWLNKGLVNDHTDGHIDDVACFVGPSKIICAYEEDKSDENFERLDENYKILENSLDENGQKLEVIKIPMPHMNYDDGIKAPVSYVNFYIGNKTVLVPTFNDLNDEKALAIIKSCFVDRTVVGIDCRDLIYGGGTIHCITQQEPEI